MTTIVITILVFLAVMAIGLAILSGATARRHQLRERLGEAAVVVERRAAAAGRVGVVAFWLLLATVTRRQLERGVGLLLGRGRRQAVKRAERRLQSEQDRQQESGCDAEPDHPFHRTPSPSA